MNVAHPLELYTTFYGWAFYGHLWTLLAESGLIYLPFGGFLVSGTLEAMQREPETAGARSRAPVLVETAAALVVMALAAMPMVTLSAGSLTFQRACKPEQRGAPGGSGTTYDKSLQFTTEKQAVQVPAWWMLALKVSYGINAAAIQGMGCVTDLAQLKRNLDSVHISDPALWAETREFADTCYLQARSALQQTGERALFTGLAADADGRDVDWMGSAAIFGAAPRRPHPL